jgi:hypothetical protein
MVFFYLTFNVLSHPLQSHFLFEHPMTADKQFKLLPFNIFLLPVFLPTIDHDNLHVGVV